METQSYAVIRTGGKQYRVAEGDLVRIEKLSGEKGDEVQFAEVLMLGGQGAAKVGTPLIAGATVKGQILRQAKAPKVLHFRKEKEGWKRRRGHRQEFTEVRITSLGQG